MTHLHSQYNIQFIISSQYLLLLLSN